MRKRDFNRLVKQLAKNGCWDPHGAAKDIVRIAEKPKKKPKKGGENRCKGTGILSMAYRLRSGRSLDKPVSTLTRLPKII